MLVRQWGINKPGVHNFAFVPEPALAIRDGGHGKVCFKTSGKPSASLLEPALGIRDGGHGNVCVCVCVCVCVSKQATNLLR